MGTVTHDACDGSPHRANQKSPLGQDAVDHPSPFNPRQALVQPLVGISETLVVDAQLLQDGSVEVVDVHRIASDVVGEIIGLTVLMTCANARTGDPCAEAAPMVVAAMIGLGQIALGVDSAAKFTPPDQERVIQEAPSLEVHQQSR